MGIWVFVWSGVDIVLSAWALYVAMGTLFGEQVRVYYKKNKKNSIIIVGPPEVGKTTYIYQLENSTPEAPTLEKTHETGFFNKVIDVKYGDTTRKIRTRDVPGEGYYNGMWWKLLIDLKPSGVIFIVDERMANPYAGAEQIFALKTFIRMITGGNYKELVPKRKRVKVFLLVANKCDVWGPGMEGVGHNQSIDAILEPAKEELHKLQRNNITWNWAAMSAKYNKQVQYTYEWVIKKLEE